MQLAESLPSTLPALYKVMGFDVFYSRSQLASDATDAEKQAAFASDFGKNEKLIAAMRKSFASQDEIELRTQAMQSLSLPDTFWSDERRAEKIAMLAKLLKSDDQLNYSQIAVILSERFEQGITTEAVGLFVIRHRELLGVEEKRRVRRSKYSPLNLLSNDPEAYQRFIDRAYELYYAEKGGYRNSRSYIIETLNLEFGLSLTKESWEYWRAENPTLVPIDPNYQRARVAELSIGFKLNDEEAQLVDQLLLAGYSFSDVFDFLMLEGEEFEFEGRKFSKRKGSDIEWLNWKPLWEYVKGRPAEFPSYYQFLELQRAKEVEISKEINPVLVTVLEIAVTSKVFVVTDSLVELLVKHKITGAMILTRIKGIIQQKNLSEGIRLPSRNYIDNKIRRFQES